MLLIKLACAGSVIACFSFVGMEFARQLNKQLVQIKLMQSAVSQIESSIRFGNRTLRDIFQKLSLENGETGSFFAYTVQKMNEKLPLKTIWQRYEEEAAKGTIPKSALAILSRCGSALESSDLEASINCLKIAERELTALHDEYYSEYRSKMKTYPAVGLLSGLFISVLFI